MLNRPAIDGLPQSPTSSAAWDWDATPAHRLIVLAALFIVPLFVITVRIADLQYRLQPAFTDVFSRTHTELVELPAREGRLLAADGTVLADDVLQYDLLVHYRRLEDPPDPRWLRRKAWERLNRSERRQSALVAAQEGLLRQERQAWWRELQRLTGHPESELRQTARSVQDRVDSIWASVDDRRRSGDVATSTMPVESTKDTAWWETIWLRVQHELTAPPVRLRHEPLVIAEQETAHVLLTNVAREIADEVEAHPDRYPGVTIAVRPRRVYPLQAVAPHILGSRTPLRPEEIDPAAEQYIAHLPEDYRPGDPYGRSGLERQYESLLHGTRGVRRITYDRHGEELESHIELPAEHGRDLVMTLDLPLQQKAEALLDAALVTPPPSVTDDEAAPVNAPTAPPPGGCLIAIDVQTGALLTAACAPRYDANLLVHPDAAAWQKLIADPRKPLYPRVTQMALPPGSVFKALTAIALLESGVFQPHDHIQCQGYLDHPGQHRCLVFRHYGVGHGETDLSAALSRSCNVYFFTGARRAGPQILVDWSQRLGIGQPTGLDLAGETGGALPSPARPGEDGPRWYPGDTLGLAIGQSSLKVTPLQMARLMAAIANGGFLVTPHFATTSGPTSIETDGSASVRPVFAHPEPQPIPGLHPATLAAIREGLYNVVNDSHGTAYKTVRLKEVAIAGKTGTAEVGGNRPDHAWFAGYAPADHPRVAFAVVIEHGGSGSKVAGPIARDYVKALLDTGLITRSAPLAER